MQRIAHIRCNIIEVDSPLVLHCTLHGNQSALGIAFLEMAPSNHQGATRDGGVCKLAEYVSTAFEPVSNRARPASRRYASPDSVRTNFLVPGALLLSLADHSIQLFR